MQLVVESIDGKTGAELERQLYMARKLAEKKAKTERVFLFSSESVHGGLWRSGYTLDSLGYPAAIVYFIGLAMPYLIAIGAAVPVAYLYKFLTEA